MRQLNSHPTALFGVIGLSLLLVGCEGGPGFMRGSRLRPIPDSWLPLSERHYATGEYDSIRIRVAGFRHHLIVMFNLLIENAGTSEVRLCQECVTVDSPRHEFKHVLLAWGKEPNHVGEYDFDHGSFVIPAGATRLIEAAASFSGPKPQTIRIDIALSRTQGQSNTLSFNFRVPGN